MHFDDDNNNNGTVLCHLPVSPCAVVLRRHSAAADATVSLCSVVLQSVSGVSPYLWERVDTTNDPFSLLFCLFSSSLMDREVTLLAEMDKVKAEASK